MPLRVKIGDQVLEAPDGLSDANLLLWAKSHAPMQEPTTFSGGFHQRLKDEPIAGGEVGFVEGLPGGVISGVKGLVTLPFYVVKGLISTIQDMGDPAAAFEKYEQAWKDKPGEVRDTLKQYVKLAQTDPEAFGKEVGALTGSAEAGIAASGLVPMSPKGIAAKIGPKLETLGKRAEFPLMLSGAHELASGNVMQGVGTMMAPSAIKSTGKAIREFGGLRIHPDESAKLEGKFNDAMTNRNVKFADEQAKTAAKGPMPSGTRDVDLQPSGAPIRVDYSRPYVRSTERMPLTGGPNVTSRKSAQATIDAEAKAAESARKKLEIDKAKEGLVESKPTVTRTVREGDESVTTKFKPKEKTPDELVEEQLAAIKKRTNTIAPQSRPPVAAKPSAPIRAKDAPTTEMTSESPEQWRARVQGKIDASQKGAIRIASPSPMPAEDVNRIGANAATMGNKAVSDMRTAGMDVPESGIRSTQDIDKMVAGPQPKPPVSDFDKVMSETNVPDIEVVEGGGKPTAARMPIRLAAPAKAGGAVPDEWLEAVDNAVKRSGSKSKSFMGANLSPNDVQQALTMYRADPTLAPELAAERLEMLRSGRAATYRETAGLDAGYRRSIEGEER